MIRASHLKRLDELETRFDPLDGFKAILRTEMNRLLSIHGSEVSVRQALGVRVLAVIDEDPPGDDLLATWVVDALQKAGQRPGATG